MRPGGAADRLRLGCGSSTTRGDDGLEHRALSEPPSPEEPAFVPVMVDAILEREARDPEFAATVDDAVRTALLAKDGAGLLEK